MINVNCSFSNFNKMPFPQFNLTKFLQFYFIQQVYSTSTADTFTVIDQMMLNYSYVRLSKYTEYDINLYVFIFFSLFCILFAYRFLLKKYSYIRLTLYNHM